MENNEQSNPTQNRESTVGKEETKDDQKLNINIIAQNQKEKSQNKERCNSCGVYLKDNNTYSFRMFACGHKYHISCCAEEQGKKVCYVCRKNEIKGDDEKLKQLKQGNLENEISYLEQEKHEKLEKKLEEKEKNMKLNKMKKGK